MSEPRRADANADVQVWHAPSVGTQGGKASVLGRPAHGGLLTAERLAEIEEQARKEGFRAGFAEGNAAGLAAGEDTIRKEGQRLAALFDTLAPQTAVLDQALFEQLSSLVLAIAKQFVRRELRDQPGEVVRVVREALKVLPVSGAQVSVYLNPEDLAVVQGALGPDTVERPLRLLEDVTLTRGGVRLETDASSIDATVEKRLAAIATRLLGDDREEVVPSELASPSDDGDST